MADIILPGGLRSQPQYLPPISLEFAQYSPKIVALPAAGLNLVDNSTFSFSGDATRKGGDFYFPGAASGYLDMGATAHVGAENHTFVLVSRLASFAGNSYPTPVCYPTSGPNILAFYSDQAAYSDIAIGPAPANALRFPLTAFGSVTGTWHNFVCKIGASSAPQLFCNGVELTATGTSFGSVTGRNVLGQLSESNFAQPYNGSIALFVLFNGVLPDTIARDVSRNPWQIFQKPVRRIFYSIGTGSAGTSGGVAVASGVGASISAQPGSSSGVATVSGISSSIASSVASSSGLGAASGVGAASSESVGSSNGVAAVSGVGTSSTGSTGSSSGIASASGVGSATSDSVGSANGVAAVSGVGSSLALSSGTASGIGAANGVGDSTGSGSVGSSGGVATVSGVGASVVASSGRADGSSTASGVGSSSGGQVESYSGGYGIYRSQKDREDEVRRQRIALGIIQDEQELESVEIADEGLEDVSPLEPITPKPALAKALEAKVGVLPITSLRAESQRNAELKMLLDLELEREEAAIIKMLMEM